jgi:hypothetical protein
MIRIATAVFASAALVSIYAATPSFGETAKSCQEQAAEKKLAGAAQKSFLTKCAQTSCDLQAKEQKLAGAAKNSFTKKCVGDIVGSDKGGKK